MGCKEKKEQQVNSSEHQNIKIRIKILKKHPMEKVAKFVI